MDKLPENKTINTTPDSGTFFNTLRNALETRSAKLSTATLIVIGSLSLAACSNNREPAAEATSTSQEVVEETAAPTPVETEDAEPVLDTHEFVGEPLVQVVPFEQMQAMSVEDFAKLPFADRYAYAFDQAKDSYPSINKESDPLDEYPELIPSFFWQPALNLALNDGDADVRGKLAGAYMYYSTYKDTGEITAGYQSTIDSVVQNGGEGIGGNYSYSVTDHGELQHGLDRSGNPIDFINFTYQGGSGDTFETAPETTAQAIRVELKLLNGEDVIYYTIGYAIDGHQSPDETYPY